MQVPLSMPMKKTYGKEGQETPQIGLPRLRLSRGERKKPAPKLNMNIPEEPPTASLNIFNTVNMPALPPMPKQFKNSQNGTSPLRSKKSGLSLNMGETGGVNQLLVNDTTNGLPSAATTLTIASVSTLNEEMLSAERTSALAATFKNKLMLEEEDETTSFSDSYNTETPTLESGINIGNIHGESNQTHQYADDIILNKGINDLTEYDWKILQERNLIETLEVLGEGNGGSVKKCRTLTRKPAVFALKIITTDPSPEFQKQMVRELNYNRKFDSPYIVKYYGTFLDESSSSIYICMEYMGGRSLDAVYKTFREREGRLSEKPLGKIASSVLKGLAYLNESKVMHRDIKPQNILLDSLGNVKLCDFGVSGDVVNSLASTYIGTSFYMAPERIKNEPYSISCDVWSVGLTVLEGALGEFPFIRESSPDLQISPLELLIMIIEFEPNLEDEPEDGIKWSKGFKDFIKVCLTKEGRERPSPRQMLEHPWLKKMMEKNVRMDKLVEFCWGE